METNKLYSLAENRGISIDRFSLPHNESLSLKSGNNLYIALDDYIYGAKEKVCLAHELGHCETLSFYNIYSPLDIREKHERRADRWAIKKLVPKSQLLNAFKHGYDNIYMLAEYFSVTADFMKKAIDFYKDT